MVIRPLAAACLLFVTIVNSAHAESGIASIYGRGGGKTASGERTDPTAMTAAHRTLAFGTRVTIRHSHNGRSVRRSHQRPWAFCTWSRHRSDACGGACAWVLWPRASYNTQYTNVELANQERRADKM